MGIRTDFVEHNIFCNTVQKCNRIIKLKCTLES